MSVSAVMVAAASVLQVAVAVAARQVYAVAVSDTGAYEPVASDSDSPSGGDVAAEAMCDNVDEAMDGNAGFDSNKSIYHIPHSLPMLAHTTVVSKNYRRHTPKIRTITFS